MFPFWDRPGKRAGNGFPFIVLMTPVVTALGWVAPPPLKNLTTPAGRGVAIGVAIYDDNPDAFPSRGSVRAASAAPPPLRKRLREITICTRVEQRNEERRAKRCISPNLAAHQFSFRYEKRPQNDPLSPYIVSTQH